MSYKTVDGLMRHLREKGLQIAGSAQKRQLMNIGYFHGYKGYRFFNDQSERHDIPFTSFSEVYATIKYDDALKSLFYGKVLFIETAVKNIALACILRKSKSESIQAMFNKSVSGVTNVPQGSTTAQKRKVQQSKLDLQNSVHRNLANAYRRNDPKIAHFCEVYADVPIWALFEITMMGDFGTILSCLTLDVRKEISKQLGLNLAYDTNCEFVYKHIFVLKDLRNAIAHNAVIFDTRFKTSKISKAMKDCLKHDIKLPYVNFNSIGDYVILVAYYLKLLGVPKTEIKTFINEYEKITNKYIQSLQGNVAAVKAVITKDWKQRMDILKKYL